MSEDENPYRDFRWEVPEHFNFGATIDAFGAEPGRPAILCEDQDGNRVRLCFADIREQSNRIANVLAGLGVKPGDPVIIALPRITLWQAAYVGALKAGAIVIPCGVGAARQGSRLSRQSFRRGRDHCRGRECRPGKRPAQPVSRRSSTISSRAARAADGSGCGPRWRRRRPTFRRCARARAIPRFASTLPAPRTSPRPCCTAMPTPGAIATPEATGSTCGRANCTGPRRTRDGPMRGAACCSARG